MHDFRNEYKPFQVIPTVMLCYMLLWFLVVHCEVVHCDYDVFSMYGNKNIFKNIDKCLKLSAYTGLLYLGITSVIYGHESTF